MSFNPWVDLFGVNGSSKKILCFVNERKEHTPLFLLHIDVIYCRRTNRCHDLIYPSGHDFELPPLKISVDDREQLVKVFHCKHKPEDDDSFFDFEVY